MSLAKIHTLELAKFSYEAAASSLPDMERTPGAGEVYDVDTFSLDSSSATDESDIFGYYQSSPDTGDSRASSPQNDASSSSSVASQILRSRKCSPPRTPKSNEPGVDPELDYLEDQHDFHPFKAHQKTHQETPSPTRSRSSTCNVSDAAMMRYQSTVRYNDHLCSFAEMLANHITATENLIRKTQETQAMRYFAKRLASYGEDEAAKAADVQARIVRLKANGWKRDRFTPERYQGLCERALEEL